MSIFDTILDKIGLHRPAAGMPATGPAAPGTTAKPPSMIGTSPGMFGSKPAAMPMVDVMGKMEALAKKAPDLSTFRASLIAPGKPLSQVVIDNRRKARF